jgi:hypothetical protein
MHNLGNIYHINLKTYEMTFSEHHATAAYYFHNDINVQVTKTSENKRSLKRQNIKQK